MATPNVDKLSYAELLKFHERITVAIAAKKAEDAQVTRQQLRELAQKRGFDIDELFGKRGKRGASAPKFRNPKDASQSWTGRGRKPNWLVDALKKGGKMDDFAL